LLSSAGGTATENFAFFPSPVLEKGLARAQVTFPIAIQEFILIKKKKKLEPMALLLPLNLSYHVTYRKTWRLNDACAYRTIAFSFLTANTLGKLFAGS
jgi:hypothetical protein